MLILFIVAQSNVDRNEVIDQDLVWAQLLSCRNAGYVFFHYRKLKTLTFAPGKIFPSLRDTFNLNMFKVECVCKSHLFEKPTNFIKNYKVHYKQERTL